MSALPGWAATASEITAGAVLVSAAYVLVTEIIPRMWLRFTGAGRHRRAAAKRRHPSARSRRPGLPVDGHLSRDEAAVLIGLEAATWDGIEADAASGRPRDYQAWQALAARFDRRERTGS